MKRLVCLLLTFIMILGMTACGNQKAVRDDHGEQDDLPSETADAVSEKDLLEQDQAEENAQSSATANIQQKDYTDEEAPNNEIVVPDPPKSKEYLTGLWSDYDCTETSVDLQGLQAVYSIRAEQDNRLVDCTGTYTLILEYDGAEGEWNKLDGGWLDREYTFDTDGFNENYMWFVCPKPGSDGMYLYFGDVTLSGCTISWESMDDDLTINGEYTGEAYCTFEMGGLNGDDDYPCWALNGLEMEYNWNYYGGKYQICTYYVQIQCDKINVPLDDPFGNTTGDAAVSRVNYE